MKVVWSVSIIALVLSNAISYGQDTKQKSTSPPMILFVCEHGAARSTIASVYFNKIATEKKLNYQSSFRGTDPDSAITMGTKNGLAADGFHTDTLKPQLVTQLDIERASRIVTFDCAVPMQDSLTKVTLRWDGIPPISNDYKKARNEIVERVNALVEELARSESK